MSVISLGGLGSLLKGRNFPSSDGFGLDSTGFCEREGFFSVVTLPSSLAPLLFLMAAAKVGLLGMGSSEPSDFLEDRNLVAVIHAAAWSHALDDGLGLVKLRAASARDNMNIGLRIWWW